MASASLFPSATIPSAYPFHTSVATPTSRSPQTQARINDLSTKVFTAYELQKLRTYIPDLQFKVEEAPLINFNVLDSNGDLKERLGRFIAAVYVYDILTNMMRDYNERVRNVTSSNLLTTDAKEVGKIATALRGFTATFGAAKDVYLHRIPAELLENVPSTRKIKVPVVGLSPYKTVAATASATPEYSIEVEIAVPDPDDLPMYNLTPGTSSTTPSDDCQPAKMIYHLGSGSIDFSEFASIHQDRLKKLIPTGTTSFNNPLIPFIRRDILAFNRLRIAILNAIDAWAMTDSALKSMNNGKLDDMPGYLKTLMIADQRVSGLPQPSCGDGFAGVYYDNDPTDPKSKAKIVDPYIVAADGSMVENPKARYGPYCQRKRMTSDLLSGVITGGPGQVANFHSGAARRVHKGRAKKTTRRR